MQFGELNLEIHNHIQINLGLDDLSFWTALKYRLFGSRRCAEVVRQQAEKQLDVMNAEVGMKIARQAEKYMKTHLIQ